MGSRKIQAPPARGNRIYDRGRRQRAVGFVRSGRAARVRAQAMGLLFPLLAAARLFGLKAAR